MSTLLERAKTSMALGGPPAPWEVVGNTSIRTADGQEMIFESYWNGKPHSAINEWTRQRICDAINLLPELVVEVELLEAKRKQLKADLVAVHNERREIAAQRDRLQRLVDITYPGGDAPPIRPDRDPLLAPFATLGRPAQEREWARYGEQIAGWNERHGK